MFILHFRYSHFGILLLFKDTRCLFYHVPGRSPFFTMIIYQHYTHSILGGLFVLDL